MFIFHIKVDQNSTVYNYFVVADTEEEAMTIIVANLEKDRKELATYWTKQYADFPREQAKKLIDKQLYGQDDYIQHVSANMYVGNAYPIEEKGLIDCISQDFD
jgi:hypothetical protein